MKQSKLFTKVSKDKLKDEVSINAQLLIRGGFVDKLMSGVYSFLPLGLRTLKKIENIIREEMNRIEGQEVLMPALLPKEIWEKTDRWKYPEMFKLKNRAEKEFSLGWTHEEVVTSLVKKFVDSYKSLPVSVYQFQTKFRDELRAKSGMLRGVEFPMKDLYSFHATESDLDKYYDRVTEAYFNVFKRCGLGGETFLTSASGGAFCKYSHEFQTVNPSGEDEIYLCKKCKLAINKEIIEEEKHQCSKCKSKDLEIKKSIEVGNIFKLRDKYTTPLEFTFKDKDGKKNPVLMGCYGMGLGRIMGAIVEVHHDDKGIIWPKEISPFDIHLIPLGENDKVKKASEAVYEELCSLGVEVLYDDRDKSIGEKFAEADIIGINLRMVVSERTLEKDSVEAKERNEKEAKLVKINQIKNYAKNIK